MTCWQILIATAGVRSGMFERLVTHDILPQVAPARGDVKILAYWDNGEAGGLGEVRQRLLDYATADYICFVDDDDLLAPNYVERIYPLLVPRKVDYVGFKMQYYADGWAHKPTYHSLAFDHWYDDSLGYYRDISHLNPIRRSLATQASFREIGYPEDVGWVNQMRALRIVQSEAYVEEVMYHYYASSTESLGQRPDKVRERWPFERPEINSENFEYHPRSTGGHSQDQAGSG